jgi:hypothetical protein
MDEETLHGQVQLIQEGTGSAQLRQAEQWMEALILDAE